MFPGPNATVYYNDAGEPTGWDTPYDGPPDPDDFYEAAYDYEDEDYDDDDE